MKNRGPEVEEGGVPDIDLSSAGFIAALVVSTVGMGFFMYGRRTEQPPQKAVGIALMVFPYFVHTAIWTYGIGGAIVAGYFALMRVKV